ncbi:bifunctional diguanylate cyclase/phosphodiesterase [Cellulosilyticum sp. I15G10I2]|uniref:bifunctional diguanylate cyclase/phosphodiesterase n=1 Tax=Cellulosilyticum sp. I15G10I2 TaxID=1892843 RepID=UPI00085C1593|nr:EAL domain-containing protein [Cellulosilyticum sp. I15G10I2]
MKYFYSKKLSTSFLYPILFTVFTILILTTIYDAYNHKQRLMNALAEQADSLLNISASSAQDAFWSYNDESLKKIGDALFDYKEVIEVVILDENARIIYKHKRNTAITHQSYLFPRFVQQVYKDTQKIGEIQVVFTTYYLNKAIKNEVLSRFIQTIIVNFIIFVIILLLSRTLTKSIDEIDEGVKAFSEGNVNSRIHVKNNHEIGELAYRINRLFDTIIENSKKLSDNYFTLQHKEELLRVAEERYRYAVEGSNDAIWDWNLLTGDYYISARGAKILGLSENELMDLSTWNSFLYPEDKASFEHFHAGFHHEPDSYREFQFRIIGKSGEIRWLFCRGKGILDQSNRLIRVSGFYTDITERIKAEESINQLAYYDVLTGLPNRAMLFQYLEKLFTSPNSAVTNNISGTLLFIDLDDFRTINDTKGHVVGDQMLVQVAKDLKAEIKCDIITRIGGDEFVIIQKDCDDAQAIKLSNEIINVIRAPKVLNGYEFNLSCSIGISLFPKDGSDIDTLLMKADTAMYKAKDHGKNQFKFFEQSMNDQIVHKISMHHDIRQGLLNKEFILFYQPQVEVETGKVVGVEALVRWQHPTLGLLSPIHFIELAEETGLIIPLGEYILRTACAQSTEWEKTGYKNISMSVNISAKQFNKKTLVDDILKIIDETQMRTDLLNLEVTETVAMENLESSIAIMNSLKEKGIVFSLDDFGIGYSSLTYLKTMPFNYLKIDKQFVQSVQHDNYEEVVIKAIIEIAHSMNLTVIAEGIETKDQLQPLINYKCDHVQGYYFSPPLPKNEVEKLLMRHLP